MLERGTELARELGASALLWVPWRGGAELRIRVGSSEVAVKLRSPLLVLCFGDGGITSSEVNQRWRIKFPSP